MIENQITEGLTAVEALLISVLDSDVDALREASQHIVSSGGKRVRPRVVMLSYLAAGGTNLDEVTAIGSAIEMVHTATLVHDDINDHSDTRRGQVAVHKRWGRTFALLTGDYMFSKVYEMMAPYGIGANQIMSTACVTLVEGETLQAAAAKAGEMDRETYKKVIERKTASLFRAGSEIGAIVAGADETVVHALRDYGHYLGITFQIVDDILDLIGDPEEMGKPTGLDLAQNRGVAAVKANGAAHNGNGNGVATAVAEADPVAEMLEKLRESGAADIAKIEAKRMADKARAALENVPPSIARDKLEDLITTVMDRTS